MKVTVTRSVWRVLGYTLLAIPMLLLAVDMSISHRFFPEPETSDVTETVTLSDGSTTEVTRQVLTNSGAAERRRALGWSIGLGVAGTGLAVWALKDLVYPRRILVFDDDGLVLQLRRRTSARNRYAWSDIAGVRSGVGEDDGGETPVLGLLFHDPEMLPVDPWGGFIDGGWLYLYTAEWDRPAHQVAPLIEARVTRLIPKRGG
jgi:hypothetical protein